MYRLAHCVTFVAGSLFFGSSIALSNPEFTRIGGCDSNDYMDSPRMSVSRDGSTVIAKFVNGGTYWTQAAGVQTVPTLPGTVAFNARRVNQDGSVIVGSCFVSSQSGHYIPVRWTQAGGFQPLMSEGLGRFGVGVSYDGDTVVGTMNTTNPRGWRWTPGTGVIDFGSATAVYDVSGNGTTTVGVQGDLPSYWDTAGQHFLTMPTGTAGGYASGISGNGSLAVGTCINPGTDTRSAYLWSLASGVTTIPMLPGARYAFAPEISGDGSMVVGQQLAAAPGSVPQAFFWTAATGTVDLRSYLLGGGVDLAGWSSIRGVGGVNWDGSVLAGWGTYNGAETAFIVTIPTPAAPLVLGAWAVLRNRRRR